MAAAGGQARQAILALIEAGMRRGWRFAAVARATAAPAEAGKFATGFGLGAERSCWYFDRYLPRAIDRRAPSVSPLFERNLREFPRTLITTAGSDPPRDEGERYAAALHAANVDTTLSSHPAAIHGFFQTTGALEASRQIHPQLGRWIGTRPLQAASPARNAVA